MIKKALLESKDLFETESIHEGCSVDSGHSLDPTIEIGRFLSRIGIIHMDDATLRMTNPLVLAFIGDAVYEQYVRLAVIHKMKGNMNQLHRQATRYVRATAQAFVVKNLESFLTESELDLIRRGRNQKGHTAPKNTQTMDYRLATGFESLIGYLSLKGNAQRVEEVVAKAIEIIDKYAEDTSA